MQRLAPRGSSEKGRGEGLAELKGIGALKL